ncbi:MAG TPA: hypothetical protein VNK43_01645 [Gemmatimonadales bacterium]|nr:hypothetical protein [Gemmatimonadales bacterium]
MSKQTPQFARRGIALGTLALGLVAAPLAAQAVTADIHVVLGDRHPDHPVYHRIPARRVVVVERYAPRVIVVERVRHPHRHHRRVERFWRKHGYRPVVVYFDRHHGVFYDRYDRRKPGLREVVVWERDGRYFTDREWDAREWRHQYREDDDHDWHDD